MERFFIAALTFFNFISYHTVDSVITFVSEIVPHNKNLFIMVKLELDVTDALAIESLLCMLDSHIKLGDEFKSMYARYLVALSKVGISSAVGDLLPVEFKNTVQ